MVSIDIAKDSVAHGFAYALLCPPKPSYRYLHVSSLSTARARNWQTQTLVEWKAYKLRIQVLRKVTALLNGG